MSQSSGSVNEIEWKCEICKESAKDSLDLEYQHLPGEKVFLYDKNGEIWLFCWSCKLQYHLKCVDNLPVNMKEEDFDFYYLCSECGWFVAGAYD